MNDAVTLSVDVRCASCGGGGIVSGGRHVDSDCADCGGHGTVAETVTARLEDGELVVVTSGEEMGEHELRAYVGDYAGEAIETIRVALVASVKEAA